MAWMAGNSVTTHIEVEPFEEFQASSPVLAIWTQLPTSSQERLETKQGHSGGFVSTSKDFE